MLVVANWKMYLTINQAERLAKKVAAFKLNGRSLNVVLCSSHTALEEVAEEVIESKKRWLALGAQDVFWETRGAYTGETSALDLKLLGCRYVIVGHSERRQYLHETDEMVSRKLSAALSSGLTPILCVGETAGERRGGRAEKKVVAQIKAALQNCRLQIANCRLVVAYEPVWAIGSGTPVAPAEASRMHAVIRDMIVACGWSQKTPILYGGSVNPKNVASFLRAPHIDGVLVGGASTRWSSLKKIITTAHTINQKSAI